MKFGLKETVIGQIQSVFARYPQVERAILYGSRAKGPCKTGSDIDLALVGGDDLNLKVLYRIMDDMDDLLLPYSFDLSILRYIGDPEVVDHIRRVGKLFYQKAAEPAPQEPLPPENGNAATKES
ncbi:MAG TPA: nucleotidyltransferase domain-containing protein [Candidatus Hydrogenedentes bacterium]|nr:nucleotidyltransferase domain-containing protein [Candidatus Hydrogenedentota bacterium]HOV75767.1 nucleotidyltransferase domain-containing protein [Candidatus Hydrogenedentota bacterium]HPC17342.1 nucleotidyltransferase domain-containing protein [Candidatus Hydrogenedentota bacterium]HRT20076.1 nucleotidyltransferase domain-containing protein [Candidatus Hydrogenedentota bacterium]HRT64860.1 nucleotidyltransferase domain-containing protein [Candidatus Hydrogenedentota bacterium]